MRNYTPLHFAAEQGRTEDAGRLIDAGANINAVTVFKTTPLHLAVRKGYIETAKLLIERGANVDGTPGNKVPTPLHVAIVENNSPLAKYLISAGANVDLDWDSSVSTAETSLSLALDRGLFDVADLVIANTKDVNHTNWIGCTWLHTAAKHGYLPGVRALLDKNANANVTMDCLNYTGNYTPLHFAIWKGALDVVQLLVEKGADATIKCQHGNPWLSPSYADARECAIIRKKPEIADFLAQNPHRKHCRTASESAHAAGPSKGPGG